MSAILAVVLAQLVAGPSGWAPCASGKLASVEMERTLYEAPGSTDFWVHFRVRNRTARAIGVQLEPGWQVLFPNQFGASPTEHREEIDETRLVVSPLDAAAERALRQAWKDGKLVKVPPSGELDYFRPFNGGSRAQVDALMGVYLVISIDGELRVTDGKRVEQVLPSELDSAREVGLRTPVKWGRIPHDAWRIPVR